MFFESTTKAEWVRKYPVEVCLNEVVSHYKIKQIRQWTIEQLDYSPDQHYNGTVALMGHTIFRFKNRKDAFLFALTWL